MHSATATAADRSSPVTLAAADLTRRLGELLGEERQVMVAFLHHLGEFDRRRLWTATSCSSTFEYCRRVLHLANASAFRRITTARLLGRFPQVGEMLHDGRLCLTTLALLKDVLEESNAAEVLAAAAYRTKEEVEALVALYRPKAAPASAAPGRESVRKLGAPRVLLISLPAAPVPAPAASPASPTPVAAPAAAAPAPAEPEPAPATHAFVALPRVLAEEVKPLDEELRSLRVTVSKEFLDELAEVKAALSHKLPHGTFEDVVREGFRLVLAKYARQRGVMAPSAKPEQRAPKKEAEAQPTPALDSAQPGRGRPHIPAAVRREVWQRDEGCCSWRGPDGSRCGSRWQLELDHVLPFARGGDSSAVNLSLRCRRHNQLRAEQCFGKAAAKKRPRKWERTTSSGGSSGSWQSPAAGAPVPASSQASIHGGTPAPH